MSKIYFTCLNKTPLNDPPYFMTHELKDLIENEYSTAALKACEAWEKAAADLVKRVQPGYTFTAISEAANKIPRLCYIKNYHHGEHVNEIEIDLLAHTYYIEKVQ